MDLRERAKGLRLGATEAERVLWFQLRAKRFMGLKFKRQKPMGNYIVDFVCMELGLIVELDGGQHAEQLTYDRQRSAWLEGQGFTVLRFWNNQVLGEMEAVLEFLRLWVEEQGPLSPGPSPAGGRGEASD
jgi:very-short-patch-repair endonuclease